MKNYLVIYLSLLVYFNNNAIMKYKFNFYTQYHQFYLCDKTSLKNTDSNDFWTTEATDDRMAIKSDIIGVGTECYGTIRGELNVLDSVNNQFDTSKFDHIVEGGVEIKSGILQILDCPNSNVELEVKIKPGTYRIRVYSSNLSSVIGDEGDDYYKIEIWPNRNMARKVLKKYISK